MARLLTFWALLAVLSTGCASTGNDSGSLPQGLHSATMQLPPTDPIARSVYRVLVAEIAGRRGHQEVALDQYLQLSQESDDWRVAERAVQIGIFLGHFNEVLPAARRWALLAPKQEQAKRALAVLLVRAGEADEAADLLADWLAEDPDDPQRFAQVNGMLQSVEDRSVVIVILQKLFQRYPESAEVSQAYAWQALQAEDLVTATAAADRTLSLRPDSAQAWLLKAQIMVDRDEGAAALELLANELAQRPEDEALRLGYTRLLLREGHFDGAREQVKRLAEQGSGSVGLNRALGQLAARLGDYEDADRYLQAALAGGQDKDDVKQQLLFELGRVAEQRQQYEEARDWYARVEDGRIAFDAKVRTGHVLARTGNSDAARALFEKLREEYPQVVVSLYVSEAEALRDVGETSGAMEVLNSALRSYEDDHDLLYVRALTAERIGRIDLLEADLQTILLEDPDNAHALNALGYTLADRTKRLDEALGYIQRALELLPDDAAILDSMGWVLFRLGRYEDALGHLQQAYALNPDQEIGAHLGELLWAMGRREQALRVWDESMRRTRDAPLVRATMERLGI